MPEDRHRNARVDVEGGQERAAGAARVMNLDLPDPGFSAPRAEAALDVPPFQRVAGIGREQELVAFAADADLRPFRGSAAGRAWANPLAPVRLDGAV